MHDMYDVYTHTVHILLYFERVQVKCKMKVSRLSLLFPNLIYFSQFFSMSAGVDEELNDFHVIVLSC